VPGGGLRDARGVLGRGLEALVALAHRVDLVAHPGPGGLRGGLGLAGGGAGVPGDLLRGGRRLVGDVLRGVGRLRRGGLGGASRLLQRRAGRVAEPLDGAAVAAGVAAVGAGVLGGVRGGPADLVHRGGAVAGEVLAAAARRGGGAALADRLHGLDGALDPGVLGDLGGGAAGVGGAGVDVPGLEDLPVLAVHHDLAAPVLGDDGDGALDRLDLGGRPGGHLVVAGDGDGPFLAVGLHVAVGHVGLLGRR
jgi:hypothetical protein